MKKNEKPIVVEQTFDAPVEAVWMAVTEPGSMRQWYFADLTAFRPEVGFETRFDVRSQTGNFMHIWKVTEVVPPKKISYQWKYEGYPGDSLAVFELFEQKDSTRLRLTHRVLEDFPGGIPEFERESGVAGWTFLIQKSLKEFLEKVVKKQAADGQG